MTEAKKIKIRPILGELRGYFSVAPEDHTIFDEMAKNLTDQLNGAIDELNIASGGDYNKFKVQTATETWNRSYRTTIKSLNYRNKLSGLISRLRSEFFPEEQNLGGNPSTVINTNQTQSQSQSVAIVLELQEKILSEISKHAEGSKERNFLEKLKSLLPTIKTTTDILSIVLKIGSELGLDPSSIHKLLGL